MSKTDKLKSQFGSNIDESTAGPVAAPTTRNGPPPRPAHQVGVEKARDTALIDLDRIVPDPDQPRKEFTEEAMAELVKSLKERGQLQPIRVRFDEASSLYRVIVGGRRYEAAKRAGLEKMHAVIHDGPLSPAALLELQLIENLVREDLKPVEKAQAIRRLMDEFGLTQTDIAKRLNMTQSAVSQSLSLLGLAEEIQAKVEGGAISARTATHIAKVDDPVEQLAVAAQVEEAGLTETETAQVVKRARAKASEPKGAKGRGASKKPKPPKLKTELYYNDSGYRLVITNRKGIDPAALAEVGQRWLNSLAVAT